MTPRTIDALRDMAARAEQSLRRAQVTAKDADGEVRAAAEHVREVHALLAAAHVGAREIGGEG